MNSPLFAILFGRAQRRFWRQVLIFALLSAALYALWLRFRDEIKSQSAYQVRLENVMVGDPPVWLPRSFIGEVFALLPPDADSQNLNSLDPKLADNLRIAFSSHPVVAGVESICVRYPAVVDVRLHFRTPVAVVNLTQEARDSALKDLEKSFPKEYDAVAAALASSESDEEDEAEAEEKRPVGLPKADERYIVDPSGYRLPNEYFYNHPDSYQTLPQIVGPTSRPATRSGVSGDPLVEESAAFAGFLTDSPKLREFGPVAIYAVRSADDPRPDFYFKTKNGVLVRWGHFRTDKPRPARDDDYESPAPVDRDEERQILYDAQQPKIEILFRLIAANDRLVQEYETSSREEERALASKARAKEYDVSGSRNETAEHEE